MMASGAPSPPPPDTALTSETAQTSSLPAFPGLSGAAEVVVGVPVFNSAATAPGVARAVQEGLAAAFHGVPAVVIACDGGSTDGTLEALREAALDSCPLLEAAHPVHAVHRMEPPCQGVPGREGAVREIFRRALDLGAGACAVVDAGAAGLEPAWVARLLEPVRAGGFDFVAPLYPRRAHEGTLTSGLVYPLFRSLFGLRVRNPAGGEFACSARFAAHALAQDAWDSDLARFGLGEWLTATAASDGFRICQTGLGPRRLADPGPSPALPAVVRQVAGSLFALMEDREAAWLGASGSEAVPLWAPELPPEPGKVKVDTARMTRAFRRGVRDLEPVWEQVLGPDVMRDLARIGVWDPARFYFETDLWVAVLHGFAGAWHRRAMDRRHLLEALTPLYLGWTASFVGETREGGAAQAEAWLERMCLRFEALKPALAQRWVAAAGTDMTRRNP